MLIIKTFFPFAKEAVSSLVVAYPAMHNGYVSIIYIYNHRKIWIFSCVHFSQKKPPQQTHQIRVRCEIFPTSFNLQQRNINVGHLTPEKVPPPDLAPQTEPRWGFTYFTCVCESLAA